MRNKLSDAIKLANKSALVLGSATAIAMMGVATSVQAQEGAVEEVVVTGIRGALKNAVDIKRNSTAVVDAVSAEDVGKFPDSDVGESLARIPGVTVGRQFGQGQSVSIRGAAPEMTLTLLNGQNVASTGWYDQQSIDRTFNYTLLAPELIAGIEVYKSSQADLVEGGIGGTVIVKTRKPLDLDANTVYAGVKASTGTVSDNVDPELSALYSWKNEAENFGVMAAVSASETEYIRRGDETLLGWGQVVPTTFIQDRERTSFDVAAQFAATDELQFGAHYMSMELVGDNTNTSAFLFPANNAGLAGDGGGCVSTNAAGTCNKWIVTEADAADPDATPAWGQTWARIGTMTSDTFDVDASYTTDAFNVVGRVGQTKAEGGTDLTANYGWFIGGPVAGTYDATGKKYNLDLIDPDRKVADYGDLQSAEWAAKRQPNSDEETYAQVDVEFNVDFGAIKTVKVGARTTDHEVERSTDKAFFGDLAKAPVGPENFYSGSMDLGSDGFAFPRPNGGAMIADTQDQISSWVVERAGYGTIEEENNALYVMSTFEADGVKGNFGLRYIQTDASSSYYKFDGSPNDTIHGANTGYSSEIVTDKADYHDVLPSVNVAFDLTDDVILRVSAAQAISRANYDDLFATTAQGGYNDGTPGNERITTGDIGLLPMKSAQADVSVEYYYGDGNMVSATYFVKDISNFTNNTQKLNQQIGLIDPNSGVDNWTVIQKINSGGGEVDGLELQWTHAFDNGFGTSINYTYTNGNAPAENYIDGLGVFTQASKDSLNLVGYWENDVYSARAAYNWRSKFMIRESGFYGHRMHDDFGSLDLSFSWNATDMLSVTFEAVNVLEEDSVQYGVAPAGAPIQAELQLGYPAWNFVGESRYMLGANFKF